VPLWICVGWPSPTQFLQINGTRVPGLLKFAYDNDQLGLSRSTDNLPGFMIQDGLDNPLSEPILLLEFLSNDKYCNIWCWLVRIEGYDNPGWLYHQEWLHVVSQHFFDTSKLIVNISCNSNESDVLEVDMTVDDEVLQAEHES